MRNMEIIRITSSMVHGTRGAMLIDRQPQCVTLELPWRMNEPFKSCIPVGDYLCEFYRSDTRDNTYLVLGVHDRDGILFHTANYLSELKGCIAPGMAFGLPNDPILIMQSQVAFDYMMERLADNHEFRLTIRNVF